MTPEYIDELADIADPDALWTLGWEEQKKLPLEKKRQLDTGIALRRHASHIRDLLSLMGKNRSLLITPLSPNGTARKTVATPPDHLKLLNPKRIRS